MINDKMLTPMRLCTALLLTGLAGHVHAAIYDYGATATTCTADCDNYTSFNAPPSPSALQGTLDADVGVNDSFDINDIASFSFSLNNPAAPPVAYNGSNPEIANPLPIDATVAVLESSIASPTGTFTTGGTTDANGEILSANIVLRFTTSPLSDNDTWLIIDAGSQASRTARICKNFTTQGCIFGDTQTIGFVGTLALGNQVVDTDEDGVADDVDNCSEVANVDQRDTDADGFGNRCDPDFDQSNLVNFIDLNYMKANFFSNDPDADLDGTGLVNFGDLNIMKEYFFGPPGPGAVTL